MKEEKCIICGDCVPEGYLLCPYCTKNFLHNQIITKPQKRKGDKYGTKI